MHTAVGRRGTRAPIWHSRHEARGAADATDIAVHCRMVEEAANQALDALKERGLVDVSEEAGRPYRVAPAVLLGTRLNRGWKSANGNSS